MLRKGRLVACIAALFLAQVTVVPRFSYRWLHPDLLLLGAAFLALEARFKAALWGALAIGLLRDVGSCALPGLTPLLLVPASAGLYALRERLVRESAWTDLLLTFAYTLGFGAAYAAATALLAGGSAAHLARRALGQAIFTTALSPLLFLAFARLRLVRGSAAP